MAMTTHSDAKWDEEFAPHCASLRRLKQERGWLTDAEWDDLETEAQLEGLDQLIEEQNNKPDNER
jgi:hypothetical protein